MPSMLPAEKRETCLLATICHTFFKVISKIVAPDYILLSMKNPTKLQFSLKAQIIHITSYDFDTRHGITKIDHADIVKGEDTKMGIPLS